MVILFLACFLLCYPDSYAFKVKLNGKRAKELQTHASPAVVSNVRGNESSFLSFLFSPFLCTLSDWR